MLRITVKTILIVLFFVSHNAVSQNFNGGLRLGLTGSEVSGDKLAGPNKAGFTAAAFTNFYFAEDKALQLEISYIQKGSRSVPSERNNYYTYKFNLNYVEMPLVFKYELREMNVDYVNKLGLELGMAFSYLVKSYEEEEGRVSEAGEKPDFNKFEAGIIAGMYYPLTKRLNFGLRVSNSITPIRAHASQAAVWYNMGQYHTVWSFSLIYNIL